MSYLETHDYVVIAVYLSILLAMGWYLKNRASASMEDYFIGGRRMPWWVLGISGMASNLDLAGTMLMVSFLYMLGPRALFIAFRGDAVLVLVFSLLWMGKWHRRSGCVTKAEWMIYRFGDGPAGRTAQLLAAVSQILGCVGMLAYLVIAVGLFLSTFLPFSPLTCSLVMVGIATIYTMVSGFYGVVYTHFVQSIIILIAVILVSVTAASKVADIGGAQGLSALVSQVKVSDSWLSAMPQWKTSMPAGYKEYEYLLVFMLFYLIRVTLGGMGQCGYDPIYFGARNDRECGTLSFLWTILLAFRWPMMMGFAVLGLFVVKDNFPVQVDLARAAEAIKLQIPDLNHLGWAQAVSDIANNPQAYPAEFNSRLQSLLGNTDNWAQKLQMISFQGTVNPERILPSVLLFAIPGGMRGLMLIAMMAASMSTFSSTVNWVTGMFTRDIYQKYVHPKASTKELIFASWIFIILLVASGYVFALTLKSINEVWSWILMGLFAGMLVPEILRLYWWRFNGYGFAIGTAAGCAAAILQRIIMPDLDERWVFLIILSIGFAGSVIATYLTRPTDLKVLERFYLTTRPFGVWGPLKSVLSPELAGKTKREHIFDIVSVPFVMLWQASLFMWPMLLVIGAYKAFGMALGICMAALIGMYFTWYKNLPASDDQTIDNVPKH